MVVMFPRIACFGHDLLARLRHRLQSGITPSGVHMVLAPAPERLRVPQRHRLAVPFCIHTWLSAMELVPGIRQRRRAIASVVPPDEVCDVLIRGRGAGD